MTDAALVAAAIEASGLLDRDGHPSAARFAHYVMAGRDERTIRRWRSGEAPVSPGARARMKWFVALPARRRTRLVALLSA